MSDLPVPVPPPASPPWDRKMLEALVCPVTQGPLEFDRQSLELVSRGAHLAFPIRDGIPIMLVSEARRID